MSTPPIDRLALGLIAYTAWRKWIEQSTDEKLPPFSHLAHEEEVGWYNVAEAIAEAILPAAGSERTATMNEKAAPAAGIYIPADDLAEIKEFIEGFLDGAPDATKTAEEAAHLCGLIFNAKRPANSTTDAAGANFLDEEANDIQNEIDAQRGDS